MAVNSVLPPYPLFSDASGAPLENGYLYIGQPGFEARSYPKESFFDVAKTIPTGTASGAAIRTKGGYPINGSNSPAMFYVDGDFSISICDRNGVLLYSALNTTLALNVGADVGPVRASDGTLASVGIGFDSEANTGLLRPSAGTMQAAVTGVLVAQFTPTGVTFPVTVGGAGFNSGVLAIAQPLDADLTALAALSGTGIAVRTAGNTWATRQITSSGGSVTVTNPAGVAGDINLEVSTGATLLETLTMTGTLVTMTQTFKTNKSYLFEYRDITHNAGVSRVLSVALYGVTDAAWSTAQLCTDGTNTERLQGEQVLWFPQRSTKFKSVSGVNFASSAAAGTNDGTNFTSGRLGALIKWGTAQAASQARFSLNGAGSFTAGSILVWEF